MTHCPDRVTRALMMFALAAMYTAMTPALATAQEDSIKEPPAVVKTPGEEAAAEEPADAPEELKTGMRYEGSLGIRSRPLASGLFLNAGYRLQLSDSDSLLLKNTYFEAGASVAGNPSNAWLGGYIEAVPVSILKLRLQVNYQRHFGTLGFLYKPAEVPNEDPAWDVTDLQESQNNDMGVSTNAVLAQFEVTPRVRLGRFVTILDSRLVYHASQIEGVYHTPFMDTLVESGDLFMVLRPTVGFLPIQVPNETFLMTAVRYERIQNFGATGVTRDSVGALALWGIPKSWWSTGNPQFAALAMYVLDEGPTPTDRVGSLIVSLRLTMRFGAN